MMSQTEFQTLDLQLDLIKFEKAFNSNEPRDEYGRWTATVDHRYDQRMRDQGAITVGPRLSLPQQQALARYVDFNVITDQEKPYVAEAIKAHQLDKDITLYRGVAPQVVPKLWSLQPGQVIRRSSNRFTSTTQDKEIARDFARDWTEKDKALGSLIAIKAPKFTKALDMTHLLEVLIGDYRAPVRRTLEKEKEVLFNLGARLRYEGFDKYGEQHVFTPVQEELMHKSQMIDNTMSNPHSRFVEDGDFIIESPIETLRKDLEEFEKAFNPKKSRDSYGRFDV